MRPGLVLAAASLLNLALGTFYAWSVLVTPFEASLTASRTAISAVFSVATACFVAGMLLGPALYRRLTPGQLAAVTCAMAAVGLALAGAAAWLPLVILGYGVLFGFANGFGYGLALQAVNTAFQTRRGLATGIVVATYALGAVVAAPLLSRAIPAVGLSASLYALAIVFVLVALITIPAFRTIVLAAPTSARKADGTATEPTGPVKLRDMGGLFGRMWLGFFLGATAGLMMIAHAAGLVEAYGGAAQAIVMGAVLVSIGNGFGRLGAGWLSDTMAVRWVLTVAAGLGAASLLVAYLLPGDRAMLVALAVMGTAYGIMAAGYPVAVSRYFGPKRVAAVYGQLFTAWGAGGLVGPWLAGQIYDLQASYGASLLLAAVFAAVAAVMTATFPSEEQDGTS